MKITVLIENTGPQNLYAEHGLSLLIEQAGKRYLLDGGQSESFLKNAQRMQIDLNLIDHTILSHGHYDHGNGFLAYLNQYPDRKIWASHTIFEDYYSGSKGKIHYIGLSSELKAHRDRFQLIDHDIRLDEQAALILDEIDEDPQSSLKKKLYRKNQDQFEPDLFSHELSLVFDTPQGLILFNSCSHAGLRKIVEPIRHKWKRPIYAYVGGLHMKDEQDSGFVQEQARYIEEHIQFVYTGHCTGKLSYQRLKTSLGKRIQPLTTGQRIIL
ncbi:MBL fold metallo-hydrolase [Faecalicoccus acidiformans]|uniref:MBL fold metallo-hydrolase n=1 Tax=Faecalicoccus acidiformans TaxID=915173 RepID=A0ABS2FMH1_9FIRM|nr:MBL fold metallo-hydrolase [Faecalicoccus acidiformans]MBM6831233.1 MBL fold metallo-hydrolase [Faecalicoccus acidiformans]